MKLTYDNIETLPKQDQPLAHALLSDIEDLNGMLKNHGYYDEVYIDRQDFHDEYSPERVDPCPDYYNYYSLVMEDETLFEKVKTLEELDRAIFCIYDYTQKLFKLS